MKRRITDKCYVVTDSKGHAVNVRAAKPPSPRTQAALLDLFDAAHKHLASIPDADACAQQRFEVIKRRVGRKVSVNVYDDRGGVVCQCQSSELAAFIVTAVNALPPCDKHVSSKGSGTGVCPRPYGHTGTCMLGGGD